MTHCTTLCVAALRKFKKNIHIKTKLQMDQSHSPTRTIADATVATATSSSTTSSSKTANGGPSSCQQQERRHVKVVPPGEAICLRGLRRPYYVRGFEEAVLVQPTPQRSQHCDGHHGVDAPSTATLSCNGCQRGVTVSSSSSSSPFSLTSLEPASYQYSLREAALVQLLREADTVTLGHNVNEGLRQRAWGGAPPLVRGECWRLLLEVAPAQRQRREKELVRKRGEYLEYVMHYFKKKVSSDDDGLLPKSNPVAAAATAESSAAAHRPLTTLSQDRSPAELQILHQLSLDLPRHKLSIFHDYRTVLRLERCLFLWSLRHPAVGFVQGIDDIMVQFFFVLLGEALERRRVESLLSAAVGTGTEKNVTRGGKGIEMGESGVPRSLFTTTTTTTTEDELVSKPTMEEKNEVATSSARIAAITPSQYRVLTWSTAFTNRDADLSLALNCLSDADLDIIEADAYWCGGRMLSWVQENFVYGQPGLQVLMSRFTTLLGVVDPPLSQWLQDQDVAVSQACFQWFHCLLTRELPQARVLRLWDTYLSIGPTFLDFHVYVCLALLLDIKTELIGAPFDVIMTRLKSPKPVESFSSMTEEWLESLIATAYLLSLQHPTE